MRRFSQRNSLVTLNDINITPLLDLAFVLLIIFVITTPLLEQGLNLNLPVGTIPDDVKIDPNNIRTVEVNTQGLYMLGSQWISLDQAVQSLVQTHRTNQALIVYIRADEESPLKYVAAILDGLEANGIGNVSLRTRPKN